MRNILYPVIILLIVSACQYKNEVDLIIHDALIYDGSGEAPYKGNIAVNDGIIVAVGGTDGYFSSQVLDAEGYSLTPGFIDPHSHGNPFETPDFQNFLAQGITTICLGQDGSGPSKTDFQDWFDGADTLGLGVNVSTLIGHGTIRRLSGVADNQEPTLNQLLTMRELLAEGINLGAYGMSTGLEYIPGFYAKENELEALAETVGEKGGIIMSHMRNEDDYAVEESLRELIRQGKYTRVQASHLKAVYGKGKERADELLEIIDSARNAGIDIYADVYPYTASHTGIGIVFPEWAKAPFDYDSIRSLKRDDLREYLIERISYRNGPSATLFGTSPWSGQTLEQVADSLGRHYADVLIDDIGPRGASAAYFVMDEELQQRLLQYDYSMLCTDGSPTMRHPRGYGSFPKFIREFVLRDSLFPMESAIEKMSALPAKSIGIQDRGMIQEGLRADILVFKPEEMMDMATFQNPYQLSQGVSWIIMNGEMVKSPEGFTGKRKGILLRKGTN